MSDSTSLLDLLSASQGGKDVTANALLDSCSSAILFARRASTTANLTWGGYGGPIFSGGARSLIGNYTAALTASATNYIESDQAGAVTVSATQTPAKMTLYKAITDANGATSYEDHRSVVAQSIFFFQYAAIAMADADKTLTQPQALCESLECTGALTLARNLILPNRRMRVAVFNNTTGGFSINVKTAAGAGVAVAAGVRAMVECDGTNVNLVANSSGGYTLPIASASVLGGIKVGAGLAIDGAGVLSATASAPNTQSLTDFGQNTGTTTGLTYGYQAGTIRQDNAVTAVAAGTLALTASATNYVEITGAGVVSANTVGFTSGRFPMAQVVTGASTITTVTDKRGVIALGGVQLGAVNVFAKSQSVTPSSLTSGATIAVDASLSNNFKVVLGVNATLVNPTNLTDGMVLNFRIKQDATGGRTLAYGTVYKFPGGTAPVLSTAANAVDLMSCYYDSTDGTLACNLLKGFA